MRGRRWLPRGAESCCCWATGKLEQGSDQEWQSCQGVPLEQLKAAVQEDRSVRGSRWGLDCHTQDTETRKAKEIGTRCICTGDRVACPHSWKDRTGGTLMASQLLLVLKLGFHLLLCFFRKETWAQAERELCCPTNGYMSWARGILGHDLMCSSCCADAWGWGA